MTARSTPGWLRLTLACTPESTAWPAKNDAKLVTMPATRAMAPKTSALAAYKVPRRGTLVSDVLIMPVEYSEVMVSAPSTAITSCPTSRPIRLPGTAPDRALASADARSTALAAPLTWAAWPALNNAPMPTQTMIITSSVQ